MTRPSERVRSEARYGGLPGALRPLCLLLAAMVVFQLFYLGAQPFAAGLIPSPWDKGAHLVVYAAIAALLWLGSAGRARPGAVAARPSGRAPRRSGQLRDP